MITVEPIENREDSIVKVMTQSLLDNIYIYIFSDGGQIKKVQIEVLLSLESHICFQVVGFKFL